MLLKLLVVAQNSEVIKLQRRLFPNAESPAPDLQSREESASSRSTFDGSSNEVQKVAFGVLFVIWQNSVFVSKFPNVKGISEDNAHLKHLNFDSKRLFFNGRWIKRWRATGRRRAPF